MKAKLVLVEVRGSADRRDQILGFYSALFGEELARSFTDALESYHLPVSRDGAWFALGLRTGAADDPVADPLQVVCHFAVDDLQAAVNALTSAGGRVLTEPIAADVAERARDYYDNRLRELNAGDPDAESQGKFVTSTYVQDPDGNVIALMQVDERSRIWFGMVDHQPGESFLTPQQLVGHRKTVELGKRFASGATI